MRARLRARKNPVGFDSLHAIIDSKAVHPEEINLVLARNGWDLDGAVRIAELVAQVQVDKHTDLSPKRRASIHQLGVGVFLMAVALTLEAEAGR